MIYVLGIVNNTSICCGVIVFKKLYLFGANVMLYIHIWTGPSAFSLVGVKPTQM